MSLPSHEITVVNSDAINKNNIKVEFWGYDEEYASDFAIKCLNKQDTFLYTTQDNVLTVKCQSESHLRLSYETVHSVMMEM